MKDKQEECGCHKNCETTPHYCEKACMWPACLTPEEERELLKEIKEEEKIPKDASETFHGENPEYDDLIGRSPEYPD